jgi:hypothetical protein
MFPCPGCNQPVDPRAKFCPNCGFHLKSPAAGGKLLMGHSWADGILGFVLYWVIPSVLAGAFSLVDSGVGVLAILLAWIGTPIVLGVALRYRAMALGYVIGLGVMVALILGLLLICGFW